MFKFKCNSCGGVYFDPQPDGKRYFHACPDLTNPDFQPVPSLPKLDLRESLPRPNARDERQKPGLQFKDGEYVTVSVDPNDAQKQVVTKVQQITVSEGAGRTLVE